MPSSVCKRSTGCWKDEKAGRTVSAATPSRPRASLEHKAFDIFLHCADLRQEANAPSCQLTRLNICTVDLARATAPSRCGGVGAARKRRPSTPREGNHGLHSLRGFPVRCMPPLREAAGAPSAQRPRSSLTPGLPHVPDTVTDSAIALLPGGRCRRGGPPDTCAVRAHVGKAGPRCSAVNDDESGGKRFGHG